MKLYYVDYSKDEFDYGGVGVEVHHKVVSVETLKDDYDTEFIRVWFLLEVE